MAVETKSVKFKDHFKRLFAGERTTVVATNFVAVALSVVLAGLTWFAEPTPTAYGVGINALILVLGALVGWALAVSWVPFDDTERTVYASIGAAVTAFVTGYAVSKFDRLLEATVYPAGVPSLPALVRVGLFLAALLLAAIVIVTNRVDWLSNEGKRSQTPRSAKPDLSNSTPVSAAPAPAPAAATAAAEASTPVAGAESVASPSSAVERGASET